MMFPNDSITILLVDDDDMVREFIAHLLAEEDFHVIAAGSGEEALRLYNQHIDEVDLVVTDIVMPGLFGDQLALRLWEQDPALPILFISGNPAESLEPAVTLENGRNFLQKPFKVAELLHAMQRQLEPVVTVPFEEDRPWQD